MRALKELDPLEQLHVEYFQSEKLILWSSSSLKACWLFVLLQQQLQKLQLLLQKLAAQPLEQPGGANPNISNIPSRVTKRNKKQLSFVARLQLTVYSCLLYELFCWSCEAVDSEIVED